VGEGRAGKTTERNGNEEERQIQQGEEAQRKNGKERNQGIGSQGLFCSRS
jgi:hypothetical protein